MASHTSSSDPSKSAPGVSHANSFSGDESAFHDAVDSLLESLSFFNGSCLQSSRSNLDKIQLMRSRGDRRVDAADIASKEWRALKFFSSVRVDIRRLGQIKGTDGSVIGSRTKIKCVKNKVAPPFAEAEFDIMFNEGISSTGSLLDLALEMEIVQKRGSWFSYNGTQLAQGRDAAKELLKNDPALYADLEASVLAKLNEPAAPAK